MSPLCMRTLKERRSGLDEGRPGFALGGVVFAGFMGEVVLITQLLMACNDFSFISAFFLVFSVGLRN